MGYPKGRAAQPRGHGVMMAAPGAGAPSLPVVTGGKLVLSGSGSEVGVESDGMRVHGQVSSGHFHSLHGLTLGVQEFFQVFVLLWQ